MIRKLIALAAIPAAALALALPASAAAVRPAVTGATSVCGASCDDVSGELLGPSFILNASSFGGVGGTDQGRKVNLRAGSNSRSNEDWDIDVVGTLENFCTRYPGGNGQIAASSFACLTLPSTAQVFEANFTPNSLATSYCAGALAPVAGFKIRLEKCGTSKTFFVEDDGDADYDASTYVPLVYGADTNSSHPLVVTVNTNSTRPGNQVTLQQLNLTGSDGAVSGQLVISPVPAGPFS